MGGTWTGFLFQIQNMTPGEAIISILDVALIAYLLYRIILLIRGTRAIHLVQGLIVLLFATVVSGWLNLSVINWLLEQAQLSLLVAVPIVFQPELRRALEQVGRGRLFGQGGPFFQQMDVEDLLDDLLQAVRTMSRSKLGALIVLERETGLQDVAETGIEIDGKVSSEFLVNIFVSNTPLHDGAVIIRGDRVAAAACFLPLTEAQVDPKMGGRHRAALGITEETDALAVVVSEETGAISLAQDGRLIRNLDAERLRELLAESLAQERTLLSILPQSGGGRGA